MNNKIIKLGSFFSGIGSPEKALEKLKEEGIINDFKIEFFSEIDKNVIKSYCAIHNVDASLNLGDIKQIKGDKLPYCDLWIGGFPCQDISCSGKMKGFNFESSTRSSLGWEIIRLLNEVKEKPKFVIFENVKNITSKRFKETLNLFKEDLIKLGYSVFDSVLNAIDFNIPQNRERYFLVAILNSDVKYIFPRGNKTILKLKDFIENEVDEKYYLSDSNYMKIKDNIIYLKNKKSDNIYEINIDKYYNGNCCGIDKNCKFHQSSRVYSELGYAPTLTASNTGENLKILVKEGEWL